jgi:hypothetical protein
MVATAEDTSDFTGAMLSGTLMSEVVTSAFDTERLKVTVVLRVAIALTVGALGNISFVVRRFECNFAVLEVLELEDVLVGGGRLQVHEEHGEGEFGARLLYIPDIGDLVAEVFDFCLNVGGIDGVVHMFQYYPVVAFVLGRVEFSLFVSQGFDNDSVGIRGFWLNPDLVLGEGFGVIGEGCDLFQELQERGNGNYILDLDGKGFGGVFRAGLLWSVCFVRFCQRRIAVGGGGGWRVKPVLVFLGVFAFTLNVVWRRAASLKGDFGPGGGGVDCSIVGG